MKALNPESLMGAVEPVQETENEGADTPTDDVPQNENISLDESILKIVDDIIKNVVDIAHGASPSDD